MNFDSRKSHKRFDRDFMPFFRYLIEHVAVKKFNNEETELFCQDYTGMNNLGLFMTIGG